MTAFGQHSMESVFYTKRASVAPRARTVCEAPSYASFRKIVVMLGCRMQMKNVKMKKHN